MGPRDLRVDSQCAMLHNLTRVMGAFVAMLVVGCATSDPRETGITYQVYYYDRNGDGVVDFERHKAVGVADADWTLKDIDFDGRFDEKTLIGYAITTRKIDQAVPRNVRLSRASRGLHLQ